MATPLKTFALKVPKAPDLLIAPIDYSQTFQDQLSNALRQYFALIDNFASGVNNNFNIAYRAVKPISASYVMTAADSVVLVRALSAIQIHLPTDASLGNTVTIKDASGNFATYNCTVIGTIDNATNLVMNANYQARTFIYNGVSWNIIGS